MIVLGCLLYMTERLRSSIFLQFLFVLSLFVDDVKAWRYKQRFHLQRTRLCIYLHHHTATGVSVSTHTLCIDFVSSHSASKICLHSLWTQGQDQRSCKECDFDTELFRFSSIHLLKKSQSFHKLLRGSNLEGTSNKFYFSGFRKSP